MTGDALLAEIRGDMAGVLAAERMESRLGTLAARLEQDVGSAAAALAELRERVGRLEAARDRGRASPAGPPGQAP